MRVKWDQDGERLYETGTDRGMLYLKKDGAYPFGVAWNGLRSVEESPSGAEPTALYADNIKYLSLMSTEEYAATIGVYTYPDEFKQCNGEATVADGVTIGQQTRRAFGFCYRTIVGNDELYNDYGYKLHIIYNALAKPSSKSYETVNDSPAAVELSYEVSTTPVDVQGYKPTATVVIDSTKTTPTKMAKIEDILYGTDTSDPRLPLPEEIMEIMKAPEDVSSDDEI